MVALHDRSLFGENFLGVRRPHGRLRPPDWTRDALCVEYPHVEFFPGRGQDSRPAKADCARCMVRADCLAFAMAERITEGVWGGTSERERRALRRVTADAVVCV